MILNTYGMVYITMQVIALAYFLAQEVASGHMWKIFAKFQSHETLLGYPGAHLAPYNGSRKFLFGDFKHLWDGLH